MISFIIFFSCDNSVRKKESVIVINLSFSNASYGNINTPDTEVNRLLFEGLTKENEKGEIVAGLAQRWEISQDYKKITFYLRDNLKYSNGMPMTSEDFLRTISKWKNSKSFYEDKYLIIKAVNDKILEVEIKDKINMEKWEDVSKFYLKEFAKPVNAPKNKEISDKDKYFVYNMDSKKNLSTGPYILKEFGNEKAILKKNPNYWNKNNIRTESITFIFNKNISTALKNFEQGKIDITEIKSEDVGKIKSKSALKTSRTHYQTILNFNDKLEILENNDVRKAIVMAIERKDKMPKNYVGSFYYPYFDKMKAAVFKVSNSVPEYNPKEAKKLFEKSLGNRKIPYVFELLNYNPKNKEKALQIKKNLEENLGIKVKIISKNIRKDEKNYEKTYAFKLEDKRKNTDYEFVEIANSMPISEQTRMKELLRHLKVEKDTEENKIKMLTEMDKILAEKIPFLLIDDDVYRYYLVNPKLKGVRVGDYGNFFLSEPYIEK